MLKKINKRFKKKIRISMRSLLCLFFVGISLSVILSAIAFYHFGHSEGYEQKEAEIKTQERIQREQFLMSMELEQVWHFFLKYLMIKTMFWFPYIIIAILLGWILHGIF